MSGIRAAKDQTWPEPMVLAFTKYRSRGRPVRRLDIYSQAGYIKMNAYGGICVYAINTKVSCFDRSLKAPLYVVTDIR